AGMACRTWSGRAAWRSPASPGTLAPVRPASWNDSQHLRGRGLLLQRLAQIVRTLAQLVQQAGVLDGDHGLCGEVLHESNLPVGECSNILAVDRQSSEQQVILAQRDPKHGLGPAELDKGAAQRTGTVKLGICDVDDLI